jgi:hypothetical protein
VESIAAPLDVVEIDEFDFHPLRISSNLILLD